MLMKVILQCKYQKKSLGCLAVFYSVCQILGVVEDPQKLQVILSSKMLLLGCSKESRTHSNHRMGKAGMVQPPFSSSWK